MLCVLRWLSNDWTVPAYPPPASDSTNCGLPPPYEEIETRQEEVAEKQSSAKHLDDSTLTEPSDYAMAYKVMQSKTNLPKGEEL